MAECAFPTCTAHAEKNGYCVRHRIYAPGAASSTSKPVDRNKKSPPRPSIKSKSKKLGKAERQYKKIVIEMLAEDPWCELRTPDCTGAADGLHHMKGRGKNLLDRKFLKRSCNACNSYVERHPTWAKENGHSVSRHAKGD